MLIDIYIYVKIACILHINIHAQALQSVGLRKFVVAGVGPLGCIPNQRATGLALPGRCVDNVNEMLGAFNEGLRSLVTQLNRQHPDSTFVYTNVYGIFGDILNNPDTYGEIIRCFNSFFFFKPIDFSFSSQFLELKRYIYIIEKKIHFISQILNSTG